MKLNAQLAKVPFGIFELIQDLGLDGVTARGHEWCSEFIPFSVHLGHLADINAKHILVGFDKAYNWVFFVYKDVRAVLKRQYPLCLEILGVESRESSPPRGSLSVCLLGLEYNLFSGFYSHIQWVVYWWACAMGGLLMGGGLTCGELTELFGMVVNVYLSPVSTASVLGRQLIETPRGTSNVL